MEAIDDDTLAAVRRTWQADAKDLPALFAEPPKTGRLKSPQAMPYAQLSCVPLSRELFGTQGPWSDKRKVTITVRGLRADVVSALDSIAKVFNRDTVLVYPSGARFMRWWPLVQGQLQQDEATKSGQDVWIGIHEAEVWSARNL